MRGSTREKWIVCRVCLEKPEHTMQSIFNEDASKDLTNMILECGGVPIRKFDHYPDKICLQCLKLLRLANRFRRTCQSSYKHLSRFMAPVEIEQDEQEQKKQQRQKNRHQLHEQQHDKEQQNADETEQTDEKQKQQHKRANLRQQERVQQQLQAQRQKAKQQQRQNNQRQQQNAKMKREQRQQQDEEDLQATQSEMHEESQEDAKIEHVASIRNCALDVVEQIPDFDDMDTQEVLSNITQHQVEEMSMKVEPNEFLKEPIDPDEADENVFYELYETYDDDGNSDTACDQVEINAIEEGDVDGDHDADGDHDIDDEHDVDEDVGIDHDVDEDMIDAAANNSGTEIINNRESSEISAEIEFIDDDALQMSDNDDAAIEASITSDEDYVPVRSSRSANTKKRIYRKRAAVKSQSQSMAGVKRRASGMAGSASTRISTEAPATRSNKKPLINVTKANSLRRNNTNAIKSEEQDHETIPSTVAAVNPISRRGRPRFKEQDKEKKIKYICDICGNMYPSQGRLTEHIKVHSGIKPHECEICGHCFAQAQQLARHMNTHTGNRPYKCQYCTAAFADLSTRNKHHRIHTNERPYGCDVCGKTFTYTNTLKFHKMIHTGEKPHVCDICGKGFHQAYKLRNHKQTHEKRFPPIKIEDMSESINILGNVDVASIMEM